MERSNPFADADVLAPLHEGDSQPSASYIKNPLLEAMPTA